MEYEKLYNELLVIEAEFQELKDASSPSQKVAKASKKFKRIIHATEMFSLENVYNEEDITEFINHVVLVNAVTRGN